MKFLAACLIIGSIMIAGTGAAQAPSQKISFVEVIPVTVQFSGRLVVSFSITEGGRTDRPIITSSKSFWSEKDDFKDRDFMLIQTPKRLQTLQDFIVELKAQGWQPAGHGKDWYSYRFKSP